MDNSGEHTTRVAAATAAPTAVVAGAGIGGLATAIGLSRAGWAVTVLERGRRCGTDAGWTLGPNAVSAAAALGIEDELRACCEPSEASGTVCEPSGRELKRFRDGRDTPLLAGHEADLRAALRALLPEDCVATPCEVTEVVPARAEVTAQYLAMDGPLQGPRQIMADVLVGADGMRSTVRRSVWPDIPQPVYQRMLYWRGVTEPGTVWPLAGFQTWGRGLRFGAHPIGGKRIAWFLAVRETQPNKFFDDAVAEVRRRVGDWHEPIPELLAATPPEAVLRDDAYDLDPLDSYVSGRVALLGDAAHAMTPFLAQGACQALEDAAVLTAELGAAVRDGAPPDVAGALGRYDAARRPRTQRIARVARTDPRLGLAGGSLSHGLISGLTRAASGGPAARRGNRLWDWTPPAPRD